MNMSWNIACVLLLDRLEFARSYAETCRALGAHARKRHRKILVDSRGRPVET